ncbi:MAG: hypothetical protein V1704_02535 [Candidatus Vogelbacteria bacterium]
MIEFLYHDGIKKEIAAFERRFGNVRKGLKSFELLCEVQFHPTEPKQIIAPAKLHRLTQNNIWAMWKIELVIPKSNLRPNQYPRMWFVVKGAIIAFLCLATHIDNYDEQKMDYLAKSRLTDLL